MINAALFRQSMKSGLKLLLLFALILTVYVSVMVTMFDPEIGKALEAFAKALPEIMAMVGMDTAAATLTGFLSNYLYGFIMLVFPMVYGMLLSNRLMARPVDRGSMAFLLASPNPRRRVAFTQLLVLMLNQALLIAYATALAIVCSEAMFPGELETGRYILMNAGVFFLHTALSGLCFFAACVSNESRKALAVGGGISAVFYLIRMLANMGGRLENLTYATIFTLFDPERIIAGESGALAMTGILLLIGAVLSGAGIAVFEKRDLPL